MMNIMFIIQFSMYMVMFCSIELGCKLNPSAKI